MIIIKFTLLVILLTIRWKMPSNMRKDSKMFIIMIDNGFMHQMVRAQVGCRDMADKLATVLDEDMGFMVTVLEVPYPIVRTAEEREKAAALCNEAYAIIDARESQMSFVFH